MEVLMTSKITKVVRTWVVSLGLAAMSLVFHADMASGQGQAPQPKPTAAAQASQGDQSWTPPQDYDDWARMYYRVLKIEKKEAVKIAPDKVKINPPISAVYELVREDANYYYIRNLPLSDPESPGHKRWLAREYAEVEGQSREDYMRDKYIIVKEDDIYPPFTDRLDFVRMDAGLPKVGRWQRSFDIADMNGDGLPDLVLPPQRMGIGHPWIFLQQKDGTWRLWENVRWPGENAKLDYGTVRVADFDGDGHLDIAIAPHFHPAYVLYGDGKGDFTRAVKLPVLNSSVTAQALTVADFNNDGRPDIALLAELDVQLGTSKHLGSGLVNVMLNLPEGWKAIGDDFPPEIFGYNLAAADIFRDGQTDLILSSRQQGVRDLVFRNLGKGEKWDVVGNQVMPFNSFAFAVAAGPLDRPPVPDVVVCYQQHNPWEKETPTQACTIYHFHDADGKPTATPRPELILKQKEQFNNFLGVAIGDIDGDGRNDLAFITTKGKVRVFLQSPDGRFYEQRWPGFDLGETTLPMDIRIADLNHDGMGEIIVMGAPAGEKLGTGGGFWIFSPRRKAPAKTGS
jgi:hypothetical protein